MSELEGVSKNLLSNLSTDLDFFSKNRQSRKTTNHPSRSPDQEWNIGCPEYETGVQHE